MAKGVLDFEMEQAAVELQHINVKLLVKEPEKVDLAAVVPVFHTWIQGQIFDELLLDVADYSHVPDGPGVMLIGHEADYAVDNTDGRLGIRYNRKAPVAENNQQRLVQATRAALNAAQRLEQDLNLHFNGRDIEILVNDRQLAPNSEATRVAFSHEFEKFFSKLLAGSQCSVRYDSEPRRLFSVAVSAGSAFSVTELLANVGPESEG